MGGGGKQTNGGEEDEKKSDIRGKERSGRVGKKKRALSGTEPERV